MGRRALHTAEELKQMILRSSREILERHGIGGLSARAIAKEIGYSPGTLYNVFKNLDDLVVTIERSLLQECLAALRALPRLSNPEHHLGELTDCYIAFALKNRRLWNVLFQHNAQEDMLRLSGVDGALREIRQEFSAAILSLVSGGPASKAEDLAGAIWFCVHGISALAVSEKESDLKPDVAARHVRTMTDAVIALAQRP